MTIGKEVAMIATGYYRDGVIVTDAVFDIHQKVMIVPVPDDKSNSMRGFLHKYADNKRLMEEDDSNIIAKAAIDRYEKSL